MEIAIKKMPFKKKTGSFTNLINQVYFIIIILE